MVVSKELYNLIHLSCLASVWKIHCTEANMEARRRGQTELSNHDEK